MIISDQSERVRRFLRGLTYSIRFYVFRAAHQGASFQEVVEAAKKAELMETEEFGEVKDKRHRTSG